MIIGGIIALICVADGNIGGAVVCLAVSMVLHCLFYDHDKCNCKRRGK